MLFIRLLSTLFLASLFSFALTPLTIRLCRTVGALDTPDGKRKINTQPTPRLGGLAFFLSFSFFSLPLIFYDKFAAAILSGGSLLVAGGFADDVFDIPPFLKLIAQISAAAIAVAFIGAPTAFSFFGVFNISMSVPIGIAVAVFKMLFTVNAVNFSDGLDGLAAGLSVSAFISLFFYGLINGNTSTAVCVLILAASVIGFLPYNKYKAKTFMGDSGSQFLGFAIAIFSLGCAKNNAYTIETTLFLIVPALDTALSVLRRLAKGKSPFSADKGHIHHILLKNGIPHPVAVKLLVFINAAVGAIVLLFYYFS